MVYIPTPPPPPSREVTELSEYVTQVIEAYRADHPEINGEDVRLALSLSTPSTPGLAGRALAIGLVGFLAVLMTVFFSANRTGAPIPWMILGVAGLTIVISVLAVVARKS